MHKYTLFNKIVHYCTITNLCYIKPNLNNTTTYAIQDTMKTMLSRLDVVSCPVGPLLMYWSLAAL